MDQDNSELLKAIARFPLANFARVIGRAPCGEYYLVAVASSLIPCLCNMGLPLGSVPNSDISIYAWAPSDEKISTHGVVESTRRSSVAFAKNAAECVLSRNSGGLARCLRKAVGEEHNHLLVPMEWMVLLQAILVRFFPRPSVRN